MTIDERIEALVKASEEQRISIEKLESAVTKQHEEFKTVLESFREFKEDRWHINQSLRTLIENVDRVSAKVDKLTDNVDRLEKFFERSLTKPSNGKTKK